MSIATAQEAVAALDSPEPRYVEAFLLPENYEKNTIRRVREIGEISDDLGRMVSRQIFMTDGLEYTVKSFNPHARKTNVGVSMTVPWLTEPAGYNAHMALTLGKLGFPVDLISAERNMELKPNLAKSAHNQLQIGELTAMKHNRDSEKLIVTGVSRAAMIGLLLTALAEENGNEIIYGDYVVPCYPEALTVGNIGKHALMPLSEIKTVRHILDFPFRTLQHYPTTFSVKPKRWVNHLAAMPELTSGIAGEAVRHMPRDVRGHLTAFRGDVMSQGENWQELFADFPNMDVEIIKGGGHLSCASPLAIRSWKERFHELGNELDQ